MKQAWERALCLMELANSNEQIQIRLYGDGPTVVRVRAEVALNYYFDLMEATRAQRCALVNGPEIEREMWRQRFCDT